MKISLITVVYNNVKHIEDCIKSVISQSYSNIEYIVIDGKSRDGTLDIINYYRNNISKIISEKDKNHIYAMNEGLKLATGDVVGFLHSDDFYVNNDTIKSIMDVFNTKETLSVYGDLVYVKENNPNKIIRYWRGGKASIKKIRRGWMPPHPTFFVKKDVYRKYGLFNTNFRISMDYELILRFLYKYKISTFYLPKTIVKMRYGGISNRSFKNIVRKTTEDIKACKMHGLGVSTVIMKNFRKVNQFLKKY